MYNLYRIFLCNSYDSISNLLIFMVQGQQQTCHSKCMVMADGNEWISVPIVRCFLLSEELEREGVLKDPHLISDKWPPITFRLLI